MLNNVSLDTFSAEFARMSNLPRAIGTASTIAQ
jgi:hypothetical protein